MHRARARILPDRFVLAFVLASALVTGQASAQEGGTVTIYHCADANGQPVLRDSPCAPGQSQRRVTTMQRPTDPPPRAPATLVPESGQAPSVEAPAAAPPPARTLVVHAPAPMYECTTPEGTSYTSDDGRGNPRWVPLWTLGYGPGHRGLHPPRPPRARPPTGAPVRPATAQPRGGGWNPYGAVAYAAGGTWVQDQCHPLPQAEVCERLRERSSTLRQRFNSALQGEQREITAERKRIARRLASDC